MDLPDRVAGRLPERLRSTRAARVLAERVVRPARRRREPLLSVVVPFFEARHQLAATLEGLLAQQARLEVLLVDDGSTDGSREVADRYAAVHRQVRVLAQQHTGVGAARERGIAAARGDYLAFCDADDLLPPSGYARLVRTLEDTGSDVAVGSVVVQVQGRFEVPRWASRSNPARVLAAPIAEVPEVLGNLVVGARVFRRSSWAAHGLHFGTDERGDPALVVSSLLAAERIDVVPAVVYRCTSRADDRSLSQRDLRDRGRVADRVRSVREAGRLLAAANGGAEVLERAYYAELLTTTVSGLVRAAVCRDDGYWESLVGEVAALLEAMPAAAMEEVPVEDRLLAWLCARGERPATEEFLEYAYDNRDGYPFRPGGAGGERPLIDLRFVDVLAGTSAELTRVAPSDMRFRCRLYRVGWVGDRVLRLEGAAFAEYLDDRSGPSAVTLVVTERSTGEQVRLPARPCPAVEVNRWASRASEDHDGAGFEVEVDVAALPRPASGVAIHDTVVELDLGGFHFASSFRARHVAGSAALLEPGTAEDLDLRPVWVEHHGLELHVQPAGPTPRSGPPGPAAGDGGALAVDGFETLGDRVRLTGRRSAESTGSRATPELRLAGPRGGSGWVPAVVADGRWSVELSLLTDEWGLGTTSLPADTYEVLARESGAGPQQVACAAELWRRLPLSARAGGPPFGPWTVTPLVHEGRLALRVVPGEWRTSRPALLRRRLRDETYPAAREQPLLDTVLFETFAGKGTGDNPGALCSELAARDLGLDLVYSVIDRSTVVPEGARPVVRWSQEYFELLGRARYLVVNASLPYFFRKREGQLYFQTWHGTPLKRIAHDRPHLDFFNWHHRRQLLVARSGWDYLLSQSGFCSEALSSAFRYEGAVLELGYPRNDVLTSPVRDDVRHRVRDRLGIEDGSPVVLYAPTWRDNARTGSVFTKVLYLDPQEVVDRLPGAVVLVRGHYNSVGAADERSGSARILDVTRYPEIADLYLAADVLVTDYSSVFFDFALTDKPMVFLAPDLEEYRDDNRGFYLDYHEVVPGPVCQDTAEVVAAITGPDHYAQRRAAFRERFDPLDDGRAAERVVEVILREFPRQALGRTTAGSPRISRVRAPQPPDPATPADEAADATDEAADEGVDMQPMKETVNRVLARSTGYQLVRARPSEPVAPAGPPPRVREQVDPELVRPPGHPGVDRLVRPVFLMTPVRSGSTLLRSMLNAHSMIHAPHELHVRRLRVQPTTALSVKAMAELGHNEADLEHLLWDRVMHRELTLSGKSVFVDKTPSNAFAYKRLATIWPDARYVFLLRHPASIVASWTEATAHKWTRREATTSALKYMHATGRARANLPGLTVRYEELTADPEAVTRQICEALDLPWEAGMLRYDTSRPAVKGLGDWTDKIGTGEVQPGRPLPSAEEVPPRLRRVCRRWGYLPPLDEDPSVEEEDSLPLEEPSAAEEETSAVTGG